MTDRANLEQVLTTARAVLTVLEYQAAGYTILQIPAHLKIELDHKRKEVADLEDRLNDLQGKLAIPKLVNSRENQSQIDYKIQATSTSQSSVVSEQPLSSFDRLKLVQTLNALPQAQFEEILVALNPPRGIVADGSAIQGSRTSQLMAWVEGSTGRGLNELIQILNFYLAKPLNAPSIDSGTESGGHLSASAKSSETERVRIRGLIPFGNQTLQGPFHAYLNSEKLPYYSRSAHLALDAPRDQVFIPTEIDLLTRLTQPEVTGLIITGSGGSGKTRLMLEIGRLAVDDNWLVFRVRDRLKAESIYQLADQIEISQRVLLLVDYVETQQDFTELIETLNELNEDEGFHFRYIANCRTTYYASIRDVYSHQRVDLTPSDNAAEWFERYRKETVHHILQQCGLNATDEYTSLCRDVPILAVFLAYLHSCDREADLSSLVGEGDFGAWLLKRIRLSFNTPEIGKELALVIAQFPLNDTIAKRIYQLHPALFDKLANDGWIEQDQSGNSDGIDDANWVIIHDVLADQLLTYYLESIPNTVELFVNELLDFSMQTGCLRSTLYTLQRLASLNSINKLDWLNILGDKILESPVAWQANRDLLIGNSLLSYRQKILLLGDYDVVWDQIESEIDFQNQLSWLTRQYLSDATKYADDACQVTLARWIQVTAPKVAKVNLLLTWGLKLCPDLVQTAALTWIVNYPEKFQTHYLLRAWLEVGLPKEDIAPYVEQWCNRFEEDSHFSFICQSWLDAEGERERVETALTQWLAEHATALEAQFVYKSWLDAEGERERVETALTQWLAEHATALEAQFVYKSWLDAGGERERVETVLTQWLATHESYLEADYVIKAWLEAGGEFAVVKDFAISWFNQNWEKEESVFISKFLAKRGDLPIETVRHILSWCRVFPLHEDATWRFTQLGQGQHLFNDILAEEILITAKSILLPILAKEALDMKSCRQAHKIFIYLCCIPAFQKGLLCDHLDSLYLEWLGHPQAFSSKIKPDTWIQRFPYFQKFVNLVTSGKLSIESEQDEVKRFLAWVNRWDLVNKNKIHKSLDYLRANYPAPDLWNIVQFGDSSSQ